MSAPSSTQQQQLVPAETAGKVAKVSAPSDHKYGSTIPFAEPYWYNTFASPHYTASHRAFRAKVRAFMDEHITPFVGEWDEVH